MSQSKSTPTRDQIELRAYELYLARGCEPGHEVEDWLNAEAELDLGFVEGEEILKEAISKALEPEGEPSRPERRVKTIAARAPGGVNPA